MKYNLDKKIELLLKELLGYFNNIKSAAVSKEEKAAALVRYYWIKGCLIQHFTICKYKNNGTVLTEPELKKLMHPVMWGYVWSSRKIDHIHKFYLHFRYFGPAAVSSLTISNLHLPKNVTVSHYFLLEHFELSQRTFWLNKIVAKKLTVKQLKSAIFKAK